MCLKFVSITFNASYFHWELKARVVIRANNASIPSLGGGEGFFNQENSTWNENQRRTTGSSHDIFYAMANIRAWLADSTIGFAFIIFVWIFRENCKTSQTECGKNFSYLSLFSGGVFWSFYRFIFNANAVRNLIYLDKIPSLTMDFKIVQIFSEIIIAYMNIKSNLLLILISF